jgi:hypothetical protein
MQMRRATQLVAVVAVMAVSLGLAAGGDQDRTLTGSYLWSDTGKSGDLKAVFTPTGEAKWDVSFFFTFEGQDRVYSGTAEGTLADGALEGTVLNEKKNRTFSFKGSFTDGEFSGSHAESGRPTGSLKLKEPSRRAQSSR